jgi:hypothetical protein
VVVPPFFSINADFANRNTRPQIAQQLLAIVAFVLVSSSYGRLRAEEPRPIETAIYACG